MTSIATDKWVRCISSSGSLRGVALNATNLVRELAELHHLKGLHAQGLGEITTAALLIASYCKEGERVNLNVRGSGHFAQGLVDAYPDGRVRGYVIPQTEKNVFLGDEKTMKPVKGPWGTGLLSVLRAKGAADVQPYIGTVPLLTGHLAKDITFYWFQSEQVPSAVGLKTKVDADGRVSSAIAFLIQALPQATKQEISEIETHLHEATIENPNELLALLFQEHGFTILEETPITFSCNCSQTRAERALILSGSAELQDILDKEGKASITCDFCCKHYDFNSQAIEDLLKAVKAKS